MKIVQKLILPYMSIRTCIILILGVTCTSDVEHWKKNLPILFKCGTCNVVQARIEKDITFIIKQHRKLYGEIGVPHFILHNIHYNILSVHNCLSSPLWLESWYYWFVTLYRSFKHCLYEMNQILIVSVRFISCWIKVWTEATYNNKVKEKIIRSVCLQ